MNNHEINYSVTEKEHLPVVFGVRVHKYFLYGQRYKIITDHAGLKWLITVKNQQCTSLYRWLFRLSEYDFEIQCRLGSKHINSFLHITSLSACRRVCPESSSSQRSVEGDENKEVTASLSKEIIVQAQG